MLDIVSSYNLVQYQGKLMMQTWENGENPIFESNFVPPALPLLFMSFTSTSQTLLKVIILCILTEN